MSIEVKLTAIQSELKAPKSQRNNFGNYNYRNLEDIMEAVKPLLSENNCNITITDDIVEVSERVYVKATVTITCNETKEFKSVSAFAREPFDKKGNDQSQVTGAASSYARKYACNGLFAIDDTKDADSQDNTQGDVQVKPKNTFKTKALRNGYISNIVNGIAANEPTVIKELWMELSREQQQDIWGDFGTQQQTFIRESLKS